jgi:hypothetical protein
MKMNSKRNLANRSLGKDFYCERPTSVLCVTRIAANVGRPSNTPTLKTIRFFQMMKRAGIRTSGCDDINWLLMKTLPFSFACAFIDQRVQIYLFALFDWLLMKVH